MGTALITGASAGLGAEYSRLFAADKHDLVLVARRRDRLEALARELESAHKVKARVVAADLAAPDGVSRVVDEVRRLGLESLKNKLTVQSLRVSPRALARAIAASFNPRPASNGGVARGAT